MGVFDIFKGRNFILKKFSIHFNVLEIKKNLDILGGEFKYGSDDIINLYNKLLDCCVEDKKSEFILNSNKGSIFWFVRLCILILNIENKNSKLSNNVILDLGVFESILRFFDVKKLVSFLGDEFLFILILWKFESVVENNSSDLLYEKVVFNKFIKNSEKYFNYFKILGYDVNILIEVFKSYKLIMKKHKLASVNDYFFYDDILSNVRAFKKHYFRRVEVFRNNIDVNQIGRNLLFDMNFKLGFGFSNEGFYFEVETLYSGKYNEICKNFDLFRNKFYVEGEFVLLIFCREKLLFVIGFDIINLNEIFIKQIQGIKGINIDEKINLPVIGIKVIEVWALNNGFNLVSIVGSKSGYMRLYCKEFQNSFNFKDLKKNVEEKYDGWANILKYELGEDKCWYKNIR